VTSGKLARPAGNIAAAGARKVAKSRQKPTLFPLFSAFQSIFERKITPTIPADPDSRVEMK
jgi:hypothetical protein